MLKILKKSVLDTIIYSVGTFATKLAGFILVPIYTNKQFLSEADYGVLNLAEASIQVVISVFGMGLCYGFERWFHDKEFIEKRKSIFFTILSFTVLIASIIITGSFLFSEFLSDALFSTGGYEIIFQLMMINGAFEMVAQTPNSLVRLDERPGLYTTANLVKLTVNIIGTLVFVSGMGLGLEGVYYAQLIGIAAYFVILGGFLFKHIEFRFEFVALVDIVRFRFPFLLPVIALNLFNFNDRFIFANTLGLEEAGVYSLGAKLANTIKVFLVTAIWLGLSPTIYKMMNDPNHKRFYSKVMTYLSFTVLIVVMMFSFFSVELVSILAKDDSYVRAATVIPIISLAIFFAMLKDTSLIGLNVSKKTASIAFITIGISVLNVIVNILVIPAFGMLGAAGANLLTQIIFFGLVYWIAQRQYFIPYEIGKIFLMVGVALALYLISTLTMYLSIWVSIPLKLTLIGLFPLILYWLNFYEAIELNRIQGFWSKWKNPRSWKSNIENLEF